MPTDDIFDSAWNTVSDDSIQKFRFGEGLARDLGLRGLANRMRARRDAMNQFNRYAVQNYIDDPNAMENILATEEALRQARMEQAQAPAAPETIGGMTLEQILAAAAELGMQQPAQELPDSAEQVIAVPETEEKPKEEPKEKEIQTDVLAEPPAKKETETPRSKRQTTERTGFVAPDLGLTVDSLLDQMLGANPEAESSPDSVREAISNVLRLAAEGNPQAMDIMSMQFRPADMKFMAQMMNSTPSQIAALMSEAKTQGHEKTAQETEEQSAQQDILDNPGDDISVNLPTTKGLESTQMAEGLLRNNPEKSAVDSEGNVVVPAEAADKKKSLDINDPGFWSIVKDPFANPFDNPNPFALNDEQPPEVTNDTTPTYSVDTTLMKGPDPRKALEDAGFDTREGDDISLLPSSSTQESGSVDDTSLLPKGWKNE